MSEAGYQRAIEQAAGYEQWQCIHVGSSERDDPGRPDLLLGHFARNRLVVMEVKDQEGKTSAAQRVWLDLHAGAGVETYLVRPSDWDEVLIILQSRQTPVGMGCEWPVRTTEEHERDLQRAAEDKARNAQRRARRKEWASGGDT